MSAGQVRITGGCQCGAVRYAIHEPLREASICHCRMCQKAFGAFYAPLVGAPLAGFELTRGEMGLFRSSDAVERGFCRDCGTPLSFRYIEGDRIDVSIGSLDDPSAAKPVAQYGLESRLPWVGELDSLPGRTTDESNETARLDVIGRTNHQHPDHDAETWLPAKRGQDG
ncbi:MAG TPA: GFA family protein [Afifellaceae bacterium]|nr:GFA family protein [Afifellaceae bacterium]